MRATIQKWGNSQGIRITKSILEAASLRENDKVRIEVHKGRIIIDLDKPRHQTLKERFAGYADETLSQEWQTGAATGKEVW